jgi:hypothetical protein
MVNGQDETARKTNKLETGREENKLSRKKYGEKREPWKGMRNNNS